MELEEELKVVGNSLKSLEVSEEKVCMEGFKAPLKQVLFTILPRVWG
jgi:hypothetical protein